MRSMMFQEILGNIDDDLIVAADVRAVPTKKKRILKSVLGIAAACLVAVCAIAAIPMINFNNNPSNDLVDGAGGINGMINTKVECKLTGTDYAVSNEEGYAFLESISDGIQSELKACGVQMKNFRISSAGYSHMRTGDDGNSMAVDWRDFFAYSGDEIIAVISVTKDENGLHHYSAWGSPGFAEYGKFLSEHKGDELVYLWVGDVEAVITPDNQIFCLSDIDIAIDENEVTNYYSFFKMEQNTYVPD
ncbi:MAG: hypothetical protein MJ102_04450 [Clostridia bacterium]|nr:hypothetical protein [Clostridia bacterium]